MDTTANNDDWKADMLAAWEAGELEYSCAPSAGLWSMYSSATPPGLGMPRECYRRRRPAAEKPQEPKPAPDYGVDPLNVATFTDCTFGQTQGGVMWTFGGCFQAAHGPAAVVLKRHTFEHDGSCAFIDEDVERIDRVIVEEWCDVHVYGAGGALGYSSRIDPGTYTVEEFAKLARFASARPDPNAAMIERDGAPRERRWHIGPFSCADFTLEISLPAPAGLTACAPFTHKLGGWGL